jgi:hypothetical protein
MVWLLVVRNSVRAADVSATRLDGTTATGKLQAWNEGLLVVSTPAGDERIFSDQLMSVRWLGHVETSQPDAGAAGTAELIDGTQIPMSSLQIAGKTAKLMLGGTRDSNANSIEIPTAQLAAVRFQRLDAALMEQWDEIRKQNLASDLLVVLKRDGGSLDYVEGAVGDISVEKVDFKLDGEINRIDRAKVAGIIFYRTVRRVNAQPRMFLQGRSGLRVNIAKLQFTQPSMVALTTVGGATFNWPIDDLNVADFSAGKLVYLSDIEPAAQNWASLVQLPTGYGEPRRDRSAFGGMLTLGIKDSQTGAATSQAGPRSYNKGLALRSRTELVYRLPVGFHRFTATAGIDPAAGESGNVQLSIYADDYPLLETVVESDDGPQAIDVQIKDAKRLKILVDFGQNQDSGDWLNLCDAKIVK